MQRSTHSIYRTLKMQKKARRALELGRTAIRSNGRGPKNAAKPARAKRQTAGAWFTRPEGGPGTAPFYSGGAPLKTRNDLTSYHAPVDLKRLLPGRRRPQAGKPLSDLSAAGPSPRADRPPPGCHQPLRTYTHTHTTVRPSSPRRPRSETPPSFPIPGDDSAVTSSLFDDRVP